MEKTRTYIDKGPAPKFFDLAPHIHDRVAPPQRQALLKLVQEAGLVIPGGNREPLLELVETAAQDEEQSLYRVLWLEEAGQPRACLAFGLVSATDDTYDCFGVAAQGPEWAEKALAALGRWLALAQARMMRFEVDTGHAAVAEAAKAHGYVEEGRIADFYADGVHQLLMFWRPGK